MSKIKVRIHFTGMVDVKNYRSGDSVVMKENSTLSDLLDTIGIRKEHKRYLIAMINDKKAVLHQTLKESDEVKLLVPVGGG